MDANNLLVMNHLAYLVISLAITVWVARTLFVNGRIFLVDAFNGDAPLADSVNQLLVVGFYLVNVGYVCLALKYSEPASTTGKAIESLATQVGGVLLVLGAMHFFNLYVFSRLRRRGNLQRMPLPVAPNETLGQKA